MSFCSNCGGPTQPGDAFCGGCGQRQLPAATTPAASLVAPSGQPAPQVPPPTFAAGSPLPGRRRRAVLAAAAAIAILIVSVTVFALTRDGQGSPPMPTWDGTAFGVEPQDVDFPEGRVKSLRVAVLIPGSGQKAVKGMTLTVHYLGWLAASGRPFDNSFSRGEPVTFELGAGQVIEGWERGLVGAQSGERRQINVPAALAYGDAGTEDGVIAPDQDLTFVVDVLALVSAGTEATDASTTTETVPVTTQPPPPTTTLSPEARALVKLAEHLNQDRSVAGSLVGGWVPQLSAKYIGLDFGGVRYDAQAVLSDHEMRRAVFGAVLVSGADFRFMMNGAQMVNWYFTIVPVTYPSKAGAQRWCDEHNLTNVDCFPKLFPERA